MPKLVPNSFTSYEFSEEEVTQACYLPELTKMYFESLRSRYSEEKLHLDYNPDSPLKFMQQEAELKGQLLLLDLILANHEEAVQKLSTTGE